jgi:hypothetical protein
MGQCVQSLLRVSTCVCSVSLRSNCSSSNACKHVSQHQQTPACWQHVQSRSSSSNAPVVPLSAAAGLLCCQQQQQQQQVPAQQQQQQQQQEQQQCLCMCVLERIAIVSLWSFSSRQAQQQQVSLREVVLSCCCWLSLLCLFLCPYSCFANDEPLCSVTRHPEPLRCGVPSPPPHTHPPTG